MGKSWFIDYPDISFDHMDLNVSIEKVKAYNHPDISKFEKNITKLKSKYNNTKKKYKSYYVSINKIKTTSSDGELFKVLSDSNKDELNRINNLVLKNKKNLKISRSNLLQWNKFDRDIENVVYDYNIKKKLTDDKRLDPNLVKAVMFSETEMGTGHTYRSLITYIETKKPDAVWQLNLGRVTDYDLYFDKIIKDKDFNININWQTNHKSGGTINDIKLTAAALILKYKYAKKTQNRKFKPNKHWYNALLAFKGVSNEGIKNADKAWKTYSTGMHPNTDNFKLFELN